MNPVNSTLDAERNLEILHNFYTSATGRTEKYICNQRDWYEWNKYFTKEDLEAVIRHVLKENARRDKRYKINLALKSILDLQTFDSLRADAEQEARAIAARKRKWQPTARDEVLSTWRKTEIQEPTKEAVTAKNALFEALRKELNGQE